MNAGRHALGLMVAMVLANAGSLAGFALLAWVLGADHAFAQGTWRESDAFAAGVLVLTIVASGLAGAACRLITRRRAAVCAAGLILLTWWGAENLIRLGSQRGEACGHRPPDATFADGARLDALWEPTWSVLASPLGVVGGVLVGGALAAGWGGADPRERRAAHDPRPNAPPS